MFTNVKLSQIMSVHPITVKPNDTLDKVEDIFKKNNFHHIPVVDADEKVVGIISKTDYHMLCDKMTFFRKDQQESQNERFFKSLLASDVMHDQVAKLHMDDVLTVAAGFFRENLFHAIPIVDDQKKLVGIVTTFDMINYAYSQPMSLTDG